MPRPWAARAAAAAPPAPSRRRPAAGLRRIVSARCQAQLAGARHDRGRRRRSAPARSTPPGARSSRARRDRRACSRFRPDSELLRAKRRGAAACAVSRCCSTRRVALRAAEQTGGPRRPHRRRGARRRGLRPRLPGDGADARVRRLAGRRPGWRGVALDRAARPCACPAGVPPRSRGDGQGAGRRPRRAARIAAATGSGMLVDLGGDVATAGPAPAGGWVVRVTDDHRAGRDAAGRRDRRRRRPGDIEHHRPPMAARRAATSTTSSTRDRRARRAGMAHRSASPRPRASTPTPRAPPRSCSARRRRVARGARPAGAARRPGRRASSTSAAGREWPRDR